MSNIWVRLCSVYDNFLNLHLAGTAGLTYVKKRFTSLSAASLNGNDAITTDRLGGWVNPVRRLGRKFLED